MQRNVEVWQALLSVRSLVLPRHHDTHTWLKFASLARKSNRIRRGSYLCSLPPPPLPPFPLEGHTWLKVTFRSSAEGGGGGSNHLKFASLACKSNLENLSCVQCAESF